MEYNIYNDNIKSYRIKFDDKLVGNYHSVKYTHDIAKNNRLPGRYFLTYVNNVKQPLYIIGFKNAIEWIKDMDLKIN